MIIKYRSLFGLSCTALLIFCSSAAQAVPSFARQTGLACASCHTTFPELTAFGRDFKLKGYTLSSNKRIDMGANGEPNTLSISDFPPISVMLQANATQQKASSPSANVELPNQLSLFLAGRISPDMGAFIQTTMGQGTGFSMDNTDIRLAKVFGSTIYGLTLNNNPTVQDVWNSTPAWGYPWTGGAAVTAPLVAGGLAQNVAGLGAYAKWDNGIYGELSLYRETNGFDAPGGGVLGTARIKGLAPYWRLAWDRNFSNGDTLMVGTYGIQAKVYDNASSPLPGDDQYTDVAIDTQYEHPFSNSRDMLSVHASYTHEKQKLGLSAPGTSPTLKSLRLDGTYHWDNEVTTTLGLSHNSGNAGAYDDNAWTAQLSYLPWQNTKFTLQYTGYTKLAGSTSSVSDNNTLLAQAWLMW